MGVRGGFLLENQLPVSNKGDKTEGDREREEGPKSDVDLVRGSWLSRKEGRGSLDSIHEEEKVKSNGQGCIKGPNREMEAVEVGEGIKGGPDRTD